MQPYCVSKFTCLHYSRFYQSLVRNLSFKYKEVHAAAAEVIGMTLKHLLEENDKVIFFWLIDFWNFKILNCFLCGICFYLHTSQITLKPCTHDRRNAPCGKRVDCIWSKLNNAVKYCWRQCCFITLSYHVFNDLEQFIFFGQFLFFVFHAWDNKS